MQVALFVPDNRQLSRTSANFTCVCAEAHNDYKTLPLSASKTGSCAASCLSSPDLRPDLRWLLAAASACRQTSRSGIQVFDSSLVMAGTQVGPSETALVPQAQLSSNTGMHFAMCRSFPGACMQRQKFGSAPPAGLMWWLVSMGTWATFCKIGRTTVPAHALCHTWTNQHTHHVTKTTAMTQTACVSHF